MWLQLLFVLLTALLSSAFTLLMAWWLWQRRLKKELQDEIDAQVAQGIDELGRKVEDSVRQGIKEGVAALPSSEVLADATRTVARTGAEIVGAGIDSLLGNRRK